MLSKLLNNKLFHLCLLVNNYQGAGTYEVTWNGKNDLGQHVASGTYIYQVNAGSFSQTKNFLDLPYIETDAKVDTLVIPDRIYLNNSLFEKDSKGKMSVE